MEEKIEAYKQAIRINPDDAEAHTNLGLAYNNLGMYKEAIESFKQQENRGNKGVGSTYIGYGFNFLQIGTKNSDYSFIHACRKTSCCQLFPVTNGGRTEAVAP